MIFTLAKRKAIANQYLGASGEQIEQLTHCKDKRCIAKKLISFSNVLFNIRLVPRKWIVPVWELCCVVNGRNLVQDLADLQLLVHPQLTRSPRHPKPRCTRGQGRCLLFCCTKLFCIPPTYGLVSHCLLLLSDYCEVDFGGGTVGEEPFVFHRQMSNQSVNSENLEVLHLKTKKPVISGMPGGTVFVRDDSVLLEVSVYTDYKY